MTQDRPIFIDREPLTGDYLMRMPAEALPALYDMLQSAPPTSLRWFHHVKQHLEDNYRNELEQEHAEEAEKE